MKSTLPDRAIQKRHKRNAVDLFGHMLSFVMDWIFFIVYAMESLQSGLVTRSIPFCWIFFTINDLGKKVWVASVIFDVMYCLLGLALPNSQWPCISEVPETKHKARLSAKTFDTTVMCIKMLMPWPKSKIAVLHQYQHFDWKSINISIGYKL